MQFLSTQTKKPNLYCSGVEWNRESVLALLPLIDCKGCGTCCHECKPIAVQEYEVERIADAVGLKAHVLKKHWKKFREPLWTLPSSCPFRDDSKQICKIYEVRPVVCRYFPLQRIQRPEGYVVGVTVGFCEAGRKAIEKLMEWQDDNPLC